MILVRNLCLPSATVMTLLCNCGVMAILDFILWSCSRKICLLIYFKYAQIYLHIWISYRSEKVYCDYTSLGSVCILVLSYVMCNPAYRLLNLGQECRLYWSLGFYFFKRKTIYRAITLKNKRWLLKHFCGRQQNLCSPKSREVFDKWRRVPTIVFLSSLLSPPLQEDAVKYHKVRFQASRMSPRSSPRREEKKRTVSKPWCRLIISFFCHDAVLD